MMNNTSENQINIGFIIEQALGHVTHGQNLKQNLNEMPEIEPFWVLPQQPKDWQGNIPVWRNWTLQAGLQANRGLAQISRSNRLDVLFFHTQVTAILAGRWMERVPSVVSLDATPLQYDSLGAFYAHEAGPAWIEERKFKANQSCYRRAKHLVTWSDWAKESLISDYDIAAKKITTIPPGVNVSDWEPPQDHVKPNGSVKILFVGGNLERKGGHDLLNAFREMRRAQNEQEKKQEIELHLVTKDEVPAEPGVIVYNNMRPNSPELKNLYYNSDIFCLPTYGDCLPMVLSEAGAAKLPTVTTNVAAIPEIVHEANSGYLVSPGDVHGLKSSLTRLATDSSLRKEQGATANRIVNERFDARANAQNLLQLLKEISQESI